jgi:hypothetical protein
MSEPTSGRGPSRSLRDALLALTPEVGPPRLSGYSDHEWAVAQIIDILDAHPGGRELLASECHCEYDPRSGGY